MELLDSKVGWFFSSLNQKHESLLHSLNSVFRCREYQDARIWKWMPLGESTAGPFLEALLLVGWTPLLMLMVGRFATARVEVFWWSTIVENGNRADERESRTQEFSLPMLNSLSHLWLGR